MWPEGEEKEEDKVCFEGEEEEVVWPEGDEEDSSVGEVLTTVRSSRPSSLFFIF